MSKITLEKTHSITMYFVGEQACLEFDSQFCVPLNRKQLQEVRDYCDRAMQVFLEKELGEKQ